MKLIYLSEANLQDRLFVKDLVHNFKFPLSEEVVLLHAPFGETLKDTRFVTKRLSTLFSESLIYNNGFSGDQRKLFTRQGDGSLSLNTALIRKLVAPIHMVLIGPILHTEDGPQLADPIELIRAMRSAFDIDEMILFTDNPMSPLANKRPFIAQQTDIDQWLTVYEEERASLTLAADLSPAQLASPTNYAQ